MAVLVVVEIAIHRPALPYSGGEGSRPARQRPGIISALVGRNRPVQAHVDEIRRDRLGESCPARS